MVYNIPIQQKLHIVLDIFFLSAFFSDLQRLQVDINWKSFCATVLYPCSGQVFINAQGLKWQRHSLKLYMFLTIDK